MSEPNAGAAHQLESKDPAVSSLIARLRRDLGTAAFDIVDHWTADSCAIGVAMPSDHRVLVYVSVHRSVSETYNYELEVPPTAEDAVYTVVGREAACSYDTLVAAISRHLRIASAQQLLDT